MLKFLRNLPAFFSSFAAFCLSCLTYLCSLHFGPLFITTHRRGDRASKTSPRRVKDQPKPMASIINWIIAVPAALIEHRHTFKDAVTVAGLSGYRSTRRVLSIPITPLRLNPAMKSTINGIARFVWVWSVHPHAMIAADPTSIGTPTTSNRAFSIGNPRSSFPRCRSINTPTWFATRLKFQSRILPQMMLPDMAPKLRGLYYVSMCDKRQMEKNLQKT